MFDLLIINGTVFDGLGGAEQNVDIAVKNGRIVAVEPHISASAAKTITAKGCVVCPGFIDLHSHSDYTLLVDGRGESFVRQGVTTEVIGNCGYSAAPVANPEYFDRSVLGGSSGYDPRWRTLNGYLATLETGKRLGINVATLVGHAALRYSVLGESAKIATSEQIKKLAGWLAASLEEGAWGFSTGLEYVPGAFASREEVDSLCRVTAKADALYATHVRNRDIEYQAGYQEAFDTARRSGVRLQISHAVPKYGAPREAADWLLEKLEEKEQDLDIGLDVVPYEWGAASLCALLPKDLLNRDIKHIIDELRTRRTRELIKSQDRPFWLLIRDKRWDDMLLFYSIGFPELMGKTFREIGDLLHKDPYDAILDILAEEGRNLFSVLMMGRLKEAEHLRQLLQYGNAGVISDGVSMAKDGKLSDLYWSPACYGWAPHFLASYVGKSTSHTLSEAVYRITGLPAKRLGLEDRGCIKRGYWADIVVFDPLRFQDRATLYDSHQYAKGIEHVIINGVERLEKGESRDCGCGQVLRKSIKS